MPSWAQGSNYLVPISDCRSFQALARRATSWSAVYDMTLHPCLSAISVFPVYHADVQGHPKNGNTSEHIITRKPTENVQTTDMIPRLPQPHHHTPPLLAICRQLPRAGRRPPRSKSPRNFGPINVCLTAGPSTEMRGNILCPGSFMTIVYFFNSCRSFKAL